MQAKGAGGSVSAMTAGATAVVTGRLEQRRQ